MKILVQNFFSKKEKKFKIVASVALLCFINLSFLVSAAYSLPQTSQTVSSEKNIQDNEKNNNTQTQNAETNVKDNNLNLYGSNGQITGAPSGESVTVGTNLNTEYADVDKQTKRNDTVSNGFEFSNNNGQKVAVVGVGEEILQTDEQGKLLVRPLQKIKVQVSGLDSNLEFDFFTASTNSGVKIKSKLGTSFLLSNKGVNKDGINRTAIASNGSAEFSLVIPEASQENNDADLGYAMYLQLNPEHLFNKESFDVEVPLRFTQATQKPAKVTQPSTSLGKHDTEALKEKNSQPETKQTPKLTIKPDKGFLNKDIVTVSGEGYAPNRFLYIAQTMQSASDTSIESSYPNFGRSSTVKTDENGNFKILNKKIFTTAPNDSVDISKGTIYLASFSSPLLKHNNPVDYTKDRTQDVFIPLQWDENVSKISFSETNNKQQKAAGSLNLSPTHNNQLFSARSIPTNLLKQEAPDNQPLEYKNNNGQKITITGVAGETLQKDSNNKIFAKHLQTVEGKAFGLNPDLGYYVFVGPYDKDKRRVTPPIGGINMNGESNNAVLLSNKMGNESEVIRKIKPDGSTNFSLTLLEKDKNTDCTKTDCFLVLQRDSSGFDDTKYNLKIPLNFTQKDSSVNSRSITAEPSYPTQVQSPVADKTKKNVQVTEFASATPTIANIPQKPRENTSTKQPILFTEETTPNAANKFNQNWTKDKDNLPRTKADSKGNNLAKTGVNFQILFLIITGCLWLILVTSWVTFSLKKTQSS